MDPILRKVLRSRLYRILVGGESGLLISEVLLDCRISARHLKVGLSYVALPLFSFNYRSD